jgi:hypothetical protein
LAVLVWVAMEGDSFSVEGVGPATRAATHPTSLMHLI